MEIVKNEKKKLPFFIRNGWFFLLLGISQFLYLSHYIQVPYANNIKIYSVDSIKNKISFKSPAVILGKRNKIMSIYIEDIYCTPSTIEQRNDSVIIYLREKIHESKLSDAKKLTIIYKDSFWNYMTNFITH